MSIFVVNNALPLYILRNYIGTDRTLTKRFKTGGILINTVTSAAIGSADPADANFITNCNPVSIGPFSNVTVNKNSFFCTLYAQPMHGGNNSFNFEFIFPAINILKISPSAISGTATPNSSVELFYSDICKTCSPQTYFGSTTTDANGNWNYNGPITGTVIASATLGKNTSDFSQTAVIVDSVKVINGCSANGLGSITGAIPTSAASMQWVDAQGNVVGTSADLLNVKPGKYKLVVHNGDCSDSTSYFEIKNKFQLDTSGVKKVQPSCGDASGSITGLQIANYDTQPPTFAWTDAGGKVWSNAPDLQNAPAGRYSLLIETTDKSCSQIYGPVTLNNLTGVTVDQSQVAIKPTNCSKPVGSVTNLTVTGTGTIKYIWTNAQQQQVATTKDLTGQIPGIYTVQISDDSKCNPVTLTFTIPNSSQLAIDANGIKTIAATCGDANGSISGLKVTGAAKYSWTNSSGQIVGNNVDLSNINGGDYQLTATDDCGNTLQSSVFHIDQGNKAVFPNYAVSITDVCPGSSYGSINVSTDATVKSARWVDGQGNTVGNNIELANVSPGSYQLYLTDQNGCEAFYNKYTINQIPVLQLSTAQVNDDQCSTSVGRITGVNATGGKPPYNYSWSDGAGKVIANSNDITGLPAGEYTLTVTDASSCNPISSQYTIRNQQNDISPPSVDNLQLCSPGNALLTVNNPVAGYSYRLYESENSNAPITESTDGKLTFDVKANTTVYISRLKGSCESARTAVKITVGISGLNIPNTITPNGDGVNDYWVIPGMDNYPNALVQIFTRYGQQVFEARGYAHPFDGTSNGQPLPVGVYYYIINLNSNCNLLTGNLTILR
jgi:gliding motility-associated-like protein